MPAKKTVTSKLPENYDDDILASERGCYPDGSPICPNVYSLVFPPIGFFPFYGIGNGDYHGYYWPIGRENGPPLVAFSSHDVGSLIPEHIDVESLHRCQLARCSGDSDTIDDYRTLVESATGKTPIEHDIRGLSHDDLEVLLTLDANSPYYLCASADVSIANNKDDEAEQGYRKAIEQLPEYVAAHYGLAYLLRRQRREEEASIHLRRALIGPIAFYGGSFWSDTSLSGSFRNDWLRKSLMWLQRLKKVHETLKDDPFIRTIGELTFQSGLATNPDLEILLRILDEYTSMGAFSDAALIWHLIGDRAVFETTPFRERHGLNALRFGTQLAELYDLAGNTPRAALVRDMLKLMKRPEEYRL